MGIRSPQVDLPTGITGGSDAWDSGLAGDLLSGEYFAAAPTLPTHLVRYIRNSANGSSGDASSYFCELFAYDAFNVNRAQGKTVTANFTPFAGSLPLWVDGNNSSASYIGSSLAGSSITVDLGSVMEISGVRRWHYYDDGRTFFGTRVETSVDGLTWTTIFDSAVSGTYAETSGGKYDVTLPWQQPVITGTLASTETGSDTLASTGQVIVQGDAAAQESGADTLAALGTVRVAGALAATESGGDTAAAAGLVLVQGLLAAAETGADTLAATGHILVQGSLGAIEVGADTFTATGQTTAPGVNGELIAQESGADTAAASGQVGAVFTITHAQALLLRRLCQLHGLLDPLEVSALERRAGDLVQTVTEAAGTVTIQTVAGSDGFSGSAGAMIEELAALHGLTAPLEVTATGRSAGAIAQTITTAGGVTRVVRQ